MIATILLVIAFVLFGLAGLGVVVSARVNLVALGLAFWGLVPLLGAVNLR